MVKKWLSFDFKFTYGKAIMILISILVSTALFAFSILYMIWGTEKKVEVFCAINLFCLASFTFDYLLIKSKDILYDAKRIYIRGSNKDFVELPISKIKKIKRVFFYFYKISFFDRLEIIGLDVYFYISPYPSIFRQKNIKELMSHGENN
jgi:hypothetical protein